MAFQKSLFQDLKLDITAHTTKDNQFYLNVRGELVIVFKKLIRVFSRKLGMEVLVRSNYPTKHNCDFWAQRVEAGLEVPRLVAGYEPTKALSESRLHIGYPRTKGRRFDWIYEMPNQVAAEKRRFEEEQARNAAERAAKNPGVVVVPRHEQSEEHEAG
ncbi:MAG: hypothetical protein WD875_07965 [Pirellulales bacterium]